MTAVTAAQVKQLRELTGAGMMDCKRALEESAGDLERAKDWLREKGMARAAGKAGRATREGIIDAYLHDPGTGVPNLGVLLELNCESDFVARTEDFRALAKELTLQIAGRAPRYVRREDVPADVVEREKAIYRTQAEGKPAAVVERIVQGKLDAFYAEVCLLEQPYVRDPSGKTKVADLITQAVAKLGENISVARFARFVVGETAGDGSGG
jgi:elongation factor Ts